MFLSIFGPFLISIVLVIFAASEIVHDIGTHETFEHILTETAIFFLGFLLNIYLVHRAVIQVRELKQKNTLMDQQLRSSLQENQQLLIERQQLKVGLHTAIETQMKEWELSNSELEIAFLLIKGLSHKEIADVRKTSENTVRLQCSSIYKKSNLNSRSELSAYFIEDLL